MSIKYLNLSGLEDLWINIKNYILSKIPTKTSELTNDSGYLTSHQSLDNYVTTDTAQTITGVKTFASSPVIYNSDTTGSVPQLTFKNSKAAKGSTTETGAQLIYFTDKNGAPLSMIESRVVSNGCTTLSTVAYNFNDSQNVSSSVQLIKNPTTAYYAPGEDNDISLGRASARWLGVYATNYYYGSGNVEFSTKFVTTDTAQTISGVKTLNNDTLVANLGNAYRIANSAGTGYGVFQRVDNVNWYLMVTAQNDALGSWTSARPASMNLSTGVLSINGNAATATQFSANTTVALTGDATGTSAGSKKGWSVPVTLANSGVTAGDYGPSANASPSYGGTFSVPYVTVDAKGRVTAASTKTITLPADSNTDTKVTQTVTTGNSTYPVLLCATANATATGTTTSRFSAGLTVNTRYSSIYITNKYDTANTKGVRNTSSYNNGILYFRSYDDTQMGLIRCDSHKSGYQHIYMQASNYIKDGAINPKGTATTCSIAVRVRDNGSKTIYTEGSWENSLTPYANETYDIGTSSLRWMRCYCKNFYGSYVDIAGRYIENEASTNARTCLYLKSNRDTDGKSGIYVTKFRQNRAQGSMGNSDSVFLSHDILENGTRTNAGFVEVYSNWTNNVPGGMSVYSTIATRNLGISAKPWTNVHTKNINNLEPSSLSLPNPSNSIDISAYFTHTGTGETNVYAVPSNGWIFLYLATISGCEAKVLDTAQNVLWGTTVNSFRSILMVPVVTGSTLQTQWTTEYSTVTVLTAKFYPCQGNV